MIAVWQRIIKASVTVDNQVVASVGRGALVLAGVEKDDTESDVAFIADKCANLRVFSDEDGKLNRSILDTGGEMLIVSQFTLCGDCRKGRRPSFVRAASPDKGREYYDLLCRMVEEKGVTVQKGVFQADMKVMLVNDGPVTLILKSR